MPYKIQNPLDFTDFDSCVNCTKGKQTNKRKFEANKTLDILELIHTNICGSFPMLAWNGRQYFMMLIDNFSRYSYTCLLYKKSQFLDIVKNFNAEVENQLGKRIKSMRYNCGEYYSDLTV